MGGLAHVLANQLAKGLSSQSTHLRPSCVNYISAQRVLIRFREQALHFIEQSVGNLWSAVAAMKIRKRLRGAEG